MFEILVFGLGPAVDSSTVQTDLPNSCAPKMCYLCVGMIGAGRDRKFAYFNQLAILRNLFHILEGRLLLAAVLAEAITGRCIFH